MFINIYYRPEERANSCLPRKKPGPTEIGTGVAIDAIRRDAIRRDAIRRDAIRSTQFSFGNGAPDFSLAPWLDIALVEAKYFAGLDENEISSYINYHKQVDEKTTFKDMVGNDKPWCASFVNYCLQEAGYPVSGNPHSSQDFRKDKNFVQIPNPVKGAIVVYQNLVSKDEVDKEKARLKELYAWTTKVKDETNLFSKNNFEFTSFGNNETNYLFEKNPTPTIVKGQAKSTGHCAFVYSKNAALGGNQSDAINFRNLDGTENQKLVGYFLPSKYFDKYYVEISKLIREKALGGEKYDALNNLYGLKNPGRSTT